MSARLPPILPANMQKPSLKNTALYKTGWLKAILTGLLNLKQQQKTFGEKEKAE